MKTLPSSSGVSLGLSGNGSVSCSAMNTLNDFQSCTIEAWVALHEAVPLNTGQTVAVKQPSQSDGFGLSLVGRESGTVVSAVFGTSDDVEGGSVTPGVWHHLAAVYDSVNDIITVYLDGEEVAQQILYSQLNLRSPLPVNFIVGGPQNSQSSAYFKGHIANVRVWDSARSQDEIVNDAVNIAVIDRTVSPDLRLFVDFTTVPAVDRSGGNNALTFTNATYAVVSGGLKLANNAYVVTDTNPSIDFGGTSSYTVDGWFYPTGSSGTLVGKNGTSQSDDQFELQILYQNGNQVAARRSSATSQLAPITSSAVITPNNWYHFAVTYDERSQIFSLYINGNLQAAQSFPAATSVSGPLMIGAWSGATITNGFTGTIQDVRVWNVCLMQADIRQWMYNQPVTGPDLVASFDFSVSPPVDTTDNNTFTLMAGAAQSPAAVSTSFDAASESVRLGVPVPVNAACLSQRIDPPVAPPQASPAPQIEPFTDEHRQSLLDSLLASLPADLDEAGRDKYRGRFDDAYARAQQLVRDNPNLLKVFSVVTEGGISRLVYHGLSGDVVVLDASGPVASCVVWWIEFVFALTIGFLMAIGLLPSVGQIATRLYNLVVRNPAANEALIGLITSPINVTNALEFIKTLYQQSLVWPILKLAFSSMGFWTLWFVLKTIFKIVTGIEAATALAGLIVWAAQLMNLVMRKNEACPQ